MGELRKRKGSKFYQMRFYDSDGQRVEVSTGCETYEDAKNALAKMEGDKADGKRITKSSLALTFAEALADVENDYIAQGRRSLGELQRRAALHLTPVFGAWPLRTITTAHLRAFVNQRMKAQASAGEINRELAIVRRAFRLAVADERYHGRIPAFPMLTERNTRKGFFDDTMLDAVCAHLAPPVQAVVRFAYVTGWRVQSEVLPLEWRQVDRATGEVRLDPDTTKNREGRVFPFTDALRTLIEQQWREHEALAKAGTLRPYVFHRNGSRIKSLRGAWAQACKAAGYPGYLVHDLRRSAVRNMERAGLSRSVAMQLTGHKTESVYRRYAITCEADLREGVARLNAVPASRTGAKKTPHRLMGTVGRDSRAYARRNAHTNRRIS
jgi:integrase